MSIWCSCAPRKKHFLSLFIFLYNTRLPFSFICCKMYIKESLSYCNCPPKIIFQLEGEAISFYKVEKIDSYLLHVLQSFCQQLNFQLVLVLNFNFKKQQQQQSKPQIFAFQEKSMTGTCLSILGAESFSLFPECFLILPQQDDIKYTVVLFQFDELVSNDKKMKQKLTFRMYIRTHECLLNAWDSSFQYVEDMKTLHIQGN